MLIKTKNSTYEIFDNKIRFVSGNKHATEHHFKNNDWKEFKELVEPTVGKSLIVILDFNKSENGYDMIRTSPVTEIILDKEYLN